MKTKRDRCERACRRDLHMTSCDWEQYLKLGHQAEDQYDLVDGILLTRAGLRKDDEHTRNHGLGSLIEQVWIAERCVKCLYCLSMRVRSTNAAIGLVGSKTRVGKGSESRVGRLFQHPNLVWDGRGWRRKVMIRAERSKAVREAVEEGFVCKVLGLHLQKCLSALTRTVPEKEIVR